MLYVGQYKNAPYIQFSFVPYHTGLHITYIHVYRYNVYMVYLVVIPFSLTLSF